MSRESFVFVVGLLIFMVPFLGIPRDWKEWILIGSGVFLMIVGYMLRRAAFLRSIEHESGERRAEAFVEHTPVHKNQPHTATAGVEQVFTE